MDTENYLEKYHPTLPQLFNLYKVEEDLPVGEYAFKVYKMLLLAKKNSEGLFLVTGKLLKEIRDKELYQSLDYESFNSFLGSEEIGYSRESAYLFIRAYEYLIEHLSLNPDVVGKMNISRINMMIPVLKKIEEEHGIDEAIKQMSDFNLLRHGDFVRKVNEERKNVKPQVYWSEELGKWVVSYFEENTLLQPKQGYQEAVVV